MENTNNKINKTKLTISKTTKGKYETYPVVPLRDMVMFPRMIVTIYIGRESSISALSKTNNTDNKILLVAQKDSTIDKPDAKDLHKVGVIAKVLHTLKLNESGTRNIKVLVEGQSKCSIHSFKTEEDCLFAKVKIVETTNGNFSEDEIKVMRRSLVEEFEIYVRNNRRISIDILNGILQLKENDTLCNAISAHMPLSGAKKQEILELPNVYKQMESLLVFIKSEINFNEAGRRIQQRVQKQVETNQKHYLLGEQLKAIYAELGENNVHEEYKQLKDIAEKSGMPSSVRKKFDIELQRLKSMSPMSAEANISRVYIDWLKDIPWNKKSNLVNSMDYAENIMNTDHYGLSKVKDRVLEYLAVMMRTQKSLGTVICFVGPPGVGKTSLARSIAKATGREFGKISLGGIRDEAEIRGHRKTYVGAMPGRIVRILKDLGVNNPIILLDEIDKIGGLSEYRGDPSAALLDILDPEQNKYFSDNYLEVEIDLSSVLFICTANSLNISRPLLDRMEIIKISGYVEEEKIAIAKNHLMKKQYKLNGISENELIIVDNAIEDIIRYYTRESGVRNLEREISKIMRKSVRNLISKESCQINAFVEGSNNNISNQENTSSILIENNPILLSISSDNLKEFLGNRKYNIGLIDKKDGIGLCNGLAYTEVGGDLLPIEVLIVPGKGEVKTTGKLGEVMRESIMAAWTHIKYCCSDLNIPSQYFEKHDCHVHVPEGAVPKDGPSAGCAIATAIISSITNIPVRRDIAMTGEISLHGKVLPIGGLKEKVIAAAMGGVSCVFIPQENVKDLEDVPQSAKDAIEFISVSYIHEIWSKALLSPISNHRNTFAIKNDPIVDINGLINKCDIKNEKRNKRKNIINPSCFS
ncbi:endopeptidase La [Lyticum sinuosum]|uniref:Lon protease n=1 Tax=Lyticum sinuosum TaxID=1332059 RepID=A0AAE4VJZ3_9RICK|nr:endopeptidase La [Lyticum sinuosum]MDZ5761365.1 Endopeptidase La [Lyticum sinuosum]